MKVNVFVDLDVRAWDSFYTVSTFDENGYGLDDKEFDSVLKAAEHVVDLKEKYDVTLYDNTQKQAI